jgi:hypothetical protein
VLIIRRRRHERAHAANAAGARSTGGALLP